METQRWLFSGSIRWVVETDGEIFTVVAIAEQLHSGHIIEVYLDNPNTYTKQVFKSIVTGTCGALVDEFKF